MDARARIRIGNQTAYTAPNVMEPFEYAVANDFDAFEWFPDNKAQGSGWSEVDISAGERAVIRETAQSRDMLLAVHAASGTNLLTQGVCDVLAGTILFARDIGASLFNIHLHTDNGIPAYVDAVTSLAKQLAMIGMKLSIENTVCTTPADFNELFRQLRNADLPHEDTVGICLDLGHANLCYVTRNDYLRFVDLIDPEIPIIHVHLHENYGDFDSHLTIFSGPAGRDASGIQGFFQRLVRRNYAGCIILEQWPWPPGLLAEARYRLLEIIGSRT